MRDTGGGVILFTSSISSLGHGREFTPYCVAKAGLVALTKAIAVECAPYGIRCNSVAPGPADTQQSDELERALTTLRGMVVRLGRVADAGLHDHRDLVAPHVETLLDLREEARRDGAYAVADRIRDGLVSGGIEVQDTASGTTWELDEAAGPSADRDGSRDTAAEG